MSESTTATTELTSQYAAQVTGDLERNVKEQERISAEIAALQQQLADLQHDHTVLVTIHQALGMTPPTTETAARADSVTMPAPRKQASAQSSTNKQAKANKGTASGGRTTVKKPVAAEETKGKAEAGKGVQPTLVELVRRHLTEQSEPHLAAEVATALGQAHPERNIKTTVVRTTLEGLVAKNQARRTKQGASVFYTAPDTDE
ncbi:hypothetical protein AAW14_27915 [Streptomyces hygroscopicus]|uniref:hypothetical protein n=1 Tax=Streptomyces hygroscopicus TaxID=1912 RepID=UPI00223E93A6|nr:hypothetical protein [Streptomyces hygroscopicus]MCW7945726.1 hypothetical protein [Streptomyces hygroscopicus]